MRVLFWACLVGCAVLATGCQFDAPSIDSPPAEFEPVILPACATDPAYEPNPDTRRLYRVVDVEVRFAVARNTCDADEAHLVVIDDAEENDYIFAIADRDTWLGLTDIEEEGTFVWVTGEPLGYKNWDDDEPNNQGGEDHIEMVDDGLWNDIRPDDPNTFVCECDV